MRRDSIITTIQGLSGSPDDLHQLLSFLTKNEMALQSSPAELLHALSPGDHSLGFLFILWTWLRGGLNPLGDAEFVGLASRLLRDCAPWQIRMAAGKFVAVCRTLKEQVLAMKVPRQGIAPLAAAVDKLRPGCEFLTPAHADLFQLCLLAKCYGAARGLLEEDIFEVDPKGTCLTATDFLLYCYYGARLCVGLKLHARAIELLQAAVTCPTMVANAITLQAHKALVLVSLIHTGSVAELPKYTPSVVTRLVKSECEAYTDLASAYGSHSPTAVRSAVEKHSGVFEADNNVGLVKQVVGSLVKRNIQRLTQTYVTLSLEDIARSAELGGAVEAEACLVRMIDAGEIHAQIDQKDGMVKFLEDPEAFDSPGMANHIDGQVRRCMELAAKLAEVHDRLASDKDYLSKVASKEQGRLLVGADTVTVDDLAPNL